jgi:hypothetical protein
LKIKAQQRSTEESVSLLDPHPSDLASVWSNAHKVTEKNQWGRTRFKYEISSAQVK